jgi:hypothetical protein
VWIFLGWDCIGMARGIDANGDETLEDYNFTLNGTKSVSNSEISIRELMTVCLNENDRRFAGYDPRLLRPTTNAAIGPARAPIHETLISLKWRSYDARWASTRQGLPKYINSTCSHLPSRSTEVGKNARLPPSPMVAATHISSVGASATMREAAK